MSVEQHQVIIVGAGMSGLVCGQALVDRGLRVKLLDKGRRPGGRMSTRRANPGLVFDHGAQYFTARTPSFVQRVQQWLDQGVAAPWSGRIAVLGETGRDPKPTTRYVGVPTMSAICRHLARGLDISVGVRVGRLARERAQWAVFDDEQRLVGRADTVVVAVPAGQAVDLLASCPELRSEVSGVEMAPCWSGMVAFDQRLALGFDAAFVGGSPVSWAACQRSKPGRPDAEAWVLHASVPWTQDHWTLDATVAVDRLVDAFAKAAGITMPKRIASVGHRWRYALPTKVAPQRALYSQDMTIGVCGDWCGGPRVEGAFLSGLALANDIVASF